MRYLYLFFLIVTICIVAGMTFIYAIFKDSSISMTNTFAAADVFPTTLISPTAIPSTTPILTPTVAQVVINEVSSNGTPSAEWIELLNSGGAPIDISGWTIADGNSSDILPSTSIIPPGGYAVIIPTGSLLFSSIPASAQIITLTDPQIGSGLNNTGDKVVLKNGLTEVDAMSYGNNTDVFSTPPSTPGTNQTIRRIPNGIDTDVSGDWQVGSVSLGITN